MNVVTTFVLIESSKCVKIRLRPRLRPGPRYESLQRSPRPLAGLGEGRKGQGGEGIREMMGGERSNLQAKYLATAPTFADSCAHCTRKSETTRSGSFVIFRPARSFLRPLPCLVPLLQVDFAFYLRDAMLAWVFATATCPDVCPSVCHTPVLCYSRAKAGS